MSHDRRKDLYIVPRPLSPDKLIVGPRVKPARAIEALNQYDSGELSYFVQSVVSMGYCVSFSATSDGGAISIVCYDGFTRFKGYCRHEDEYPTRLRDLLATIRGEA